MTPKITILESLPEDKIYLIPTYLHCPNCNLQLGPTIETLLKYQNAVPCYNCEAFWSINDFARQFAMIDFTKQD